jgi:hypothetical protein
VNESRPRPKIELALIHRAADIAIAYQPYVSPEEAPEFLFKVRRALEGVLPTPEEALSLRLDRITDDFIRRTGDRAHARPDGAGERAPASSAPPDAPVPPAESDPPAARRSAPEERRTLTDEDKAASVTDEKLSCLECGKSLTTLTLHLRRAHQLTPEEYREKWQLGEDYPVTAPAETRRRVALAVRRNAEGSFGVKKRRGGR